MADIAINPVTRRVQFTGNTGTGPFAFTFNILADADIAVYKNTTLLTLTTDYTVTTNANGTGSITLDSGQALISSDVLTIIGGRDLSRTTDFVTAGDLLASSLNEQLDSLVIMTQQLDEKVGRTIKTNPGDVYTDLELPTKDNRKGTVLGFNATSGDPEVGPTIADVSSLASITADIATLADIEDGTDATDAIQTVAGISSNVSTVAGISSNVTTVAGNTSNINAVAADATDIGTVAGSISNVNTVAGIDSNITTVAGNTTNINTVAGNNSNITTVAGVSANVTTVAGISSDVTTVAGISSDVTTVAADGTDIGTVAASIADVNTVASNIATISAKVSKSGDTMTGDLTIQGNLTVSGTTITVDSATAQTIDLGDGDRMRFGDSNDAYIEWNGTYFDFRSTGRFDLLSSGNDLRLSTGTNIGVIVNHTGGTPAVQLYNSGVQRLATTSTGIDVTGTVTADGLTVDGSVGLGVTAPSISEGYQLHTDTVGNGIWGGFGNVYLTSNYKFNSTNKFAGTGYAQILEVVPSTGAFTFKSSSASGTADATATMQSRMNIATNGDISFYEDTGTTAKFFWDASAEVLGIGNTTAAASINSASGLGNLVVGSGSGVEGITIYSGSTNYGGLNFADATSGGGSYAGYIKFDHSNNSFGHYIGNTERMRIDSSGNVGIGTSSITRELELWNSDNTVYGSTTRADAGTNLRIFNTSNTNSVYAGLTLSANNGGSTTSEFTIANVSTSSNYQGELAFQTRTGVSSYAERMRIDSSGNVGIGTSSPSSFNSAANNLVVGAGASGDDTGITIYTNSNSSAHLLFADGTSGNASYAAYIRYNHPSDFMAFHNNGGNERMRIDSSGNVLVGTTDSTPYNNSAGTSADRGVVLSNSGWLAVARDGQPTAYFNRTQSDGGIVDFRKDGSTVGSIASRAGVVTSVILNPSTMGITEADTGGGPSLSPTNGSGATSDAAIDLGTSSIRWQDLYLSGGVYLGGTGSANKLDDYEEGTWTPSLSGATGETYGTQQGFYTKIGNHVTCQFYMQLTGAPTGGSNVNIVLPFAPQGSVTSIHGGRLLRADALTVSNVDIYHISPYSGSTGAFIYATNGTVLNYISAWSTGVISGSFVYTT